jgi:hypothetical protein
MLRALKSLAYTLAGSFRRKRYSSKQKRLEIRSVPALECLEERMAPAATVGAAPDTTFQTTLVADFTGDAKADVATYAFHQWTVLASDGSRLESPQFWADWTQYGSFTNFLVGDFNGDGKADIAGLNRAGQWVVGLSNGGGFDTTVWSQTGPIPHAVVLAGDFNGDGKTDIAELTSYGGLVVFESTGSSFNLNSWATGLSGAWTRMVVGDFNGDGMADIAGLKQNVWYVAASNGTGFDVQAWGVWDGPVGSRRIVVGDFNGDGKTDVAGVTPLGDLWVGTSTGTSFVTSTWASGWTTAVRFLVGDFNGDGNADVALVQGRRITVGYSNGSIISSQQVLGWAPTSGWPYGWVGDFDADGHSDIAMRANGMWFLTRFDGSALPDAQLAYLRYPGEAPPYLPGASWLASNSRVFVAGTWQPLLKKMDFNNFANFSDYVYNFRFVLRRWQTEAAMLGLMSDPQGFHAFLTDKLNEEFSLTRDLLASKYPGLTDIQYRLLMSMNLASGYFNFARGSNVTSLWQLMGDTEGNCAHLAQLVRWLAVLQGIPATDYAIALNFPTPYGQFAAGHNLVFAGGMLLDAEIDCAFNIGSLGALESIAPGNRLSTLLNDGKVYGFYNWLDSPPVRNEQLSRGQDGGVIAFYYYWYLMGIDQGNTRVWAIPPMPY